MSRADMIRRIEALENAENNSVSVWFPDMPKPVSHDKAGLRVEFPDSEEECE